MASDIQMVEPPPVLEHPSVLERPPALVLDAYGRSPIRHRSRERHNHRSEDARAMSTGDYVGIAAGAISTVLVWVSEPTDSWFSPPKHLTHCRCKTHGSELVCDDCIPVPFLVFEGWMATTFFIATVVIFRLIWRHGRWPLAAFHALFVIPLFLWSVYQGVPLAFRNLVFTIDAGMFGVVLSIWMCYYWLARRRARSLPVTV